MGIARSFGVDYSDVLTWSDFMRCSRCRIEVSQGRLEQLSEAIHRIDIICNDDQHADILVSMVAHANERWGKMELHTWPLKYNS